LVDHLVLIVSNIKKTKDFYSKIFGTPEFEDKESLMWRIGETQIFYASPWKEVKDNKFEDNRIGLEHISFGVQTRKELVDMEQKLNDAGIKNSGIYVDQYKGTCITFKDTDAIKCEFYLREN